MKIFDKRTWVGLMVCSLLVLGAGCVGQTSNGGQLSLYNFPSIEASWIRNGEPILFEGKLWYPTDNVENLQDSEVFLMGEYQDVQVFIEKTDVKPYDRLYTKFANSQFRSFTHREDS